MSDLVELDKEILIIEDDESTTTVEIVESDVLIEDGSQGNTYIESPADTVIVSDESPPDFEIVSVAEQGPQGPQGVQGPPGLQGPQGLRGESGVSDGKEFLAIAATDLSGHRIVHPGAGNTVEYIGNDSLRTDALGMTKGAALQDAQVVIITSGQIEEPSWNWQLGTPVYLGKTGLLTQQVPLAQDSRFCLVIGVPMSPTSLFIRISIPLLY